MAVLYADGCSRKEVARRLGIGPGTVRSHLDAIFRKLEVHSRLALHRLLAGTRRETLPACVRRVARPLPPLVPGSVVGPRGRPTSGPCSLRRTPGEAPPSGSDPLAGTEMGATDEGHTHPAYACRAEVTLRVGHRYDAVRAQPAAPAAPAPARGRDGIGDTGGPGRLQGTRAGGVVVLFADGADAAALRAACEAAGASARIVLVTTDRTGIVCRLRTADGWATLRPAAGGLLVLEDQTMRVVVEVSDVQVP